MNTSSINVDALNNTILMELPMHMKLISILIFRWWAYNGEDTVKHLAQTKIASIGDAILTQLHAFKMSNRTIIFFCIWFHWVTIHILHHIYSVNFHFHLFKIVILKSKAVSDYFLNFQRKIVPLRIGSCISQNTQ